MKTSELHVKLKAIENKSSEYALLFICLNERVRNKKNTDMYAFYGSTRTLNPTDRPGWNVVLAFFKELQLAGVGEVRRRKKVYKFHWYFKLLDVMKAYTDPNASATVGAVPASKRKYKTKNQDETKSEPKIKSGSVRYINPSTEELIEITPRVMHQVERLSNELTRLGIPRSLVPKLLASLDS